MHLPTSIAVITTTVGFVGCRSGDENRATEMCRHAEHLEQQDRRSSLELKRRIAEEMPTAGTVAANRCLRSVRERMGRVRLLVKEDQIGAEKTVDACAWLVDAVEVFEHSTTPPFRKHWANRLLEQCADVLGRAWTRDPDAPRYMRLNQRLKQLLKSK